MLPGIILRWQFLKCGAICGICIYLQTAKFCADQFPRAATKRVQRGLAVTRGHLPRPQVYSLYIYITCALLVEILTPTHVPPDVRLGQPQEDRQNQKERQPWSSGVGSKRCPRNKRFVQQTLPTTPAVAQSSCVLTICAGGKSGAMARKNCCACPRVYI